MSATAPSRSIAATAGAERRRNLVPNLLGWLVFLIAAFPVYWMVLTSFRRGVDIHKAKPEFVPSPGTLENYRKVFERDFFWTAVKNSLTVTLLVSGAGAVHRVPRRGRRLAIPVPRSPGVHRDDPVLCRWCRPRR